MKVLYLTPWYPTDEDAMLGLFVQKHVQAVEAQGIDVRVIHTQKWRDLWQQWRQIHKEWGKPDIVQLNIIQKQAFLALWLRWWYDIPFIIVEHWSGYLSANGSFGRTNSLKKWFTRIVMRHAEQVLTVSRCLEQAMRQCGLHASRWGRINNVVDDFFYTPYKQQQGKKKILLHISCFDEQAKNTEALLNAFRIICNRRSDIQLVMIGTGKDYDYSQHLATALSIDNQHITWTGEQTPEQVCEWLQRANAFVLTSRYETAGIVLCEAAATGTPILSTRVGIAEDIINGQTGILITQEEANAPDVLSAYIEQVIAMDKYPSAGQEFRAESIGKQLIDIYDSSLYHYL